MSVFPYHKKQFIYFYSFSILIFSIWLFANHLGLHQYQPLWFTNRLDFSLNVILSLGLGRWMLQSHLFKVILDVGIILLPIVFILCTYKKWKLAKIFPYILMVFMWGYGLLLTSVSSLSIEGFAAFVLIPFVFMGTTEKGYYFRFQIVRYSFILIFFSAGLWKIRAGGLFHIEQMSAILLNQHSSLLIENDSSNFIFIIKYLIQHPVLSWSLYAAGTLIELSFVIGFFTKKADTILMVLLLLFISFNYFVMRINYMCWLPFVGLFYFSAYHKLPLLKQPHVGAGPAKYTGL